MRHDNLDLILNRRAAPPSSGNLAERIIHLAVTRGQERAVSVWQELLGMFLLPNPSVAFATTILLGVTLGLQAGDGFDLLQMDWTSFLDTAEGDWL